MAYPARKPIMTCCTDSHLPSRNTRRSSHKGLRDRVTAAAAFVAMVTITALAASVLVIGDLPLPLAGL